MYGGLHYHQHQIIIIVISIISVIRLIIVVVIILVLIRSYSRITPLGLSTHSTSRDRPAVGRRPLQGLRELMLTCRVGQPWHRGQLGPPPSSLGPPPNVTTTQPSHDGRESAISYTVAHTVATKATARKRRRRGLKGIGPKLILWLAAPTIRYGNSSVIGILQRLRVTAQDISLEMMLQTTNEFIDSVLGVHSRQLGRHLGELIDVGVNISILSQSRQSISST